MKVRIIGGGPGGLYSAWLLKSQAPTWPVRVYEKNRPDATFGFGVGLNPSTLRGFAQADAQAHEELLAASFPLRTWRMRVGQTEVRGGENRAVGIGRSQLLSALAGAAQRAGVEIEWDCAVTLADLDEADLVIAADGAASATRAALDEQLGVTAETGELAFIWCGAHIEVDSMTFHVVDTDDGVFVAHVMPYAQARCTFQVDTTLATARQLGLGAATDPDGNDVASLDYLSMLFEDALAGTTLVGNRSRWSTFTTIRCDRWSHGNVVLIGDAAHTAHYTVGSGTRLAMEDARALTTAIGDDHRDLDRSLRSYERARRPLIERLQARADRSETWWTTLPDRRRLPAAQLMLSYLTRTGAVDLQQLATTDPALVEDGFAVYEGGSTPGRRPRDAITRALRRPLDTGRWRMESRLLAGSTDRVAPTVCLDAAVAPNGVRRGHRLGPGTPSAQWPAASMVDYLEAVEPEPADIADLRRTYPDTVIFAVVLDAEAKRDGLAAQLARVEALHTAGIDGVKLEGPPELESVLDRLAVAELLRLRGWAVVAVQGPPSSLDALVAGLVAGRADLVAVTKGGS